MVQAESIWWRDMYVVVWYRQRLVGVRSGAVQTEFLVEVWGGVVQTECLVEEWCGVVQTEYQAEVGGGVIVVIISIAINIITRSDSIVERKIVNQTTWISLGSIIENNWLKIFYYFSLLFFSECQTILLSFEKNSSMSGVAKLYEKIKFSSISNLNAPWVK